MTQISAWIGANLPEWLGSLPLWGIFAMVLIALIKIWPRLKEIGVKERAGIRDPYLQRIRELADDVKTCREECDKQEARLREHIDQLQKRLNNEAWQRIQSEISLVHTLINVVDAPELRRILGALEQRRSIMPQPVGGPLADTEMEGRDP